MHFYNNDDTNQQRPSPITLIPNSLTLHTKQTNSLHNHNNNKTNQTFMPKNIHKHMVPYFFASLLALLLCSSPALAKNNKANANTTEKNKTELAAEPELDNAAHILMDYGTGQIIAQKRMDMSLPPASLTKMMTSYMLEQRLTAGTIKENDMIPISKNAACNLKKGESCMFLSAGKPAKAIDILRGIVIQSGNDASRAIAEHIGGTEEKFAQMMNTEAQKLGLKNTYFVNATGMPDEEHQSTAKDLALLAKAIIKKNSRYYPIYAEKHFTYNKIKQYNRNRLLFTGKSVDGLKTGHTNAAGYCLVASAKRKNTRLISVVLGTKSKAARTNQTRKLINWGFDNFKTKQISPANGFVSKAKVLFGEEKTVNLVLDKEFNVIVPKIETAEIKTSSKITQRLEAPLKKGQVVGEMTATLAGKVIAKAPIKVIKDVPRAGFFGRLWQYITLYIEKLSNKIKS